jgi:hypothetical protein
MILILTSWLFLLVSPSQKTDIYYVVHVKGLILNETRHDTLSVGDKLFSTDKLLFKSPQASAAIISPTKGRFTLGKPANKKVSASGEFMALLQNVLVGEKSIAKLSTRGFTADKVIDLKGVFSTDTFYFAGSQSKLILDPSVYPISNEQYFMYRYTYQHDKIARKRIPYNGDTLIFDKKILYAAGSHFILPEETGEIEIHKVNGKQRSSILIATIRPVFIADKELISELQTIWDIFKNSKKQKEEIMEEMYKHVLTVYGETDKNMLKIWANEHIKM